MSDEPWKFFTYTGIVSSDALAPEGFRPSADTAMAKFGHV